MENEEKDLDHSHNHQDPFTQFMFGSTHRNKNENVEEVEVSLDTEKVDWFLGRRRGNNQRGKTAIGVKINQPKLPGSLENILQNVDYTELMGHIDTLITSAGQFKPLLKKAKPIIEQFITKKN